jgi:hypothetical protein
VPVYLPLRTVGSPDRSGDGGREKHEWLNKLWIPVMFMLVAWISGILTWNNNLSILPIIAMTIDTWASWSLKPKQIRYLTLIPRPMWMVYDASVSSYPGLIGEIVTFVSVVIGIIRFDILKKQNRPAV